MLNQQKTFKSLSLSPIYAYSYKVKYGRSAACDIHGNVKVTHHGWQSPIPVHLKHKKKELDEIGGFRN